MDANEKTVAYMRPLSLYFYISYTLSSCVLTILNVLYNAILLKNYDTSTWYLTLRVSLPFDESTFIGYVLTAITQIIIGLMYLIVMCVIVTYFVGCSFFIEAMLMNLKDKIRSIDDRIKEMKQTNEMIMNEMYRESILFHIEIYRYRSTFSNVFYNQICICI